MSFIWPLQGEFVVTSEFRSASRPTHNGIDLDVPGSGYQYNVPVIASASGTVTKSYVSSSYGEVVFIKHTVNGQQFETVYAHLHEGTRTVSVGDKVNQGQRVGYMGNTGNSSGQHLHFEIHRPEWNSSANALDPRDFLSNDPEPAKEPTDYRYQDGFINPNEKFVISIENKVNGSSYEQTLINQWAVADAKLTVRGTKPSASTYQNGTKLMEVKYYNHDLGWYARGWILSGFSWLAIKALGKSPTYNQYKFRLRKSGDLYDKDGNYLLKLPGGREFYSNFAEAHPSIPGLIRCDRNETSTGTFSSVLGTYGWIDTRAEEGTWEGEFNIKHTGDSA